MTNPMLSISSYVGNQISTLPYEAVPRERDPSTAAASSVLRIQSLLRQKPPVRKQIVISPLLKRRLLSPRVGHYGAKHLRSPPAISEGSVPLDDAEILTTGVLQQSGQI